MKNGKRKYIYFVCALFTAFAVAETVFIQLAYYHNSVNSDLAGNFLAACVGLKEHTLIPQGYNHTSTLGFESHAWFMPIFLGLLKSIKKAAIASNIWTLFLFFFSTFFLLNSFKINKIVSYLYSLFLVLPFNIIMVDMHALSQYYLIQLAGAFITVGLFNCIAGEMNNLRKIIIYVAGGGISFFETLNGSRYVALVILPFVFLGGYLLFELFHSKQLQKNIDKECFRRVIFLLCVGIGVGIGYVTYSTMTNFFCTYADALGFTAIYDIELETITFFDRIKETVYLWLILWGFRLEGQNMASLSGIGTIVCLLLPILILSLSIKMGIGSKNKKVKYFACYTILSFIVPILLMAIMESVIPTVRYLYFAIYFMLLLPPIYFSATKYKTIFCCFFDTVLLLSGLCFIFLTQYKVIGGVIDTIKMETSEITTVADYRENMNEWLLANGYEYGYSTYWNANVGTVLSDCKVNHCAVYIGTDSKIYPFLGGVVRDNYNSGYHKGKTFILLTRDENNLVKENLPGGYLETYYNDMFIVYGYESNPYDFSIDLLQCFPVKNETVILESGNFLTQGSKSPDSIILNNNFEGGYLVYGPGMSFPIDAAYDIEYNFKLENCGDKSAGYIAITINGTDEIARKEIEGSGEINMILNNISFSSNDSMVQFMIYLNAGCDAEFKDIRITRIR